jgi:hypothetical protein
MLSFSTSAAGYTDQTSRLYRPVSVVSNLCSNSIVPAFPTCPTYLCVCSVRGFRPYNRSLLCFSMRLLWWTNVYTLMCFSPTFSRVFKVSIFQLRHSPFLLGLFWGSPRSHRLSSHFRLNALVFQTKLNYCKEGILYLGSWLFRVNSRNYTNFPTSLLGSSSQTRASLGPVSSATPNTA